MSAPYLSFVIARLFTSFMSEFHLYVASFKFMINSGIKHAHFYSYGLSSFFILLYRKIKSLDISFIFQEHLYFELISMKSRVNLAMYYYDISFNPEFCMTVIRNMSNTRQRHRLMPAEFKRTLQQQTAK